jgi:hypothetical protein
MLTFREFLDTKAKQQHQPERRQRREEWIAVVERLLSQLRGWLSESDPERILDVVPIKVQRFEQGLGSYDAWGLRISLGDGVPVHVTPIGRDSVGTVGLHGNGGVRAEGRVDISNEFGRVILYRTLQDGKEQWYALDDRFQPAPLERRKFEAILQDLLS